MIESIFAPNAVIENISFDRNTGLVTISYSNCPNCPNQQVVLIVDRNTIIQNERGDLIPFRELAVGMVVNASFSSAMTRSIPPQAQAFRIRIVRRMPAYETTTGRIIEVNSQNRFITTMSHANPSSIIRFNTSSDTVILNQWGRTIPFSRLMPGSESVYSMPTS